MVERGSPVRHNVYPLRRVRHVPRGLCRTNDCGGNENCRKKSFSASPRVQVRKSVIERESGDFPIRSSSPPIMIPTSSPTRVTTHMSERMGISVRMSNHHKDDDGDDDADVRDD